MTRYLSLGLFAEGPSDHEFLQPVLPKLVHSVAAQISAAPVFVAESFVRGTAVIDAVDRNDNIVRSFREAMTSLDILFVHADGDGNPVASFDNKIRPAIERIGQLPGRLPVVVGVVPIRETEAWALVDLEAIAEVLGTAKAIDELGIPSSPREVERCLDPKQALKWAQQIAIGRNRGRLPPVLSLLGERIRLDELRKLSAFQRLERDLREALVPSIGQ